MTKEHSERTYFSQSEAESKVGKRVQSREDFSDVPKGSTGFVISADQAAITNAPIDQSSGEYDVAIQWDLPTPLQIEVAQQELTNRLEIADENEITIERYSQRDRILEESDLLFAVQSGKPLVDWFTKDEYERYLDELVTGK